MSRSAGIFEQGIDGVEPKASDAAFVPPAGHVEHGVVHRGIAPVQIGLLRIEKVVVKLSGLRIHRPRRSAKGRDPIVRLGRTFAVVPHVPVALRRVTRRLRIDEPGMLIRRVIHHEIHDDANAALLRFLLHAIKIGQRSVHGIDILVIGNVVAEINLRRRIAWRNPDGINAQTFQIIQFRRDAVEVANAIVVAVRETARIDLVKHRVLPPLMTFRIDGLSLRDNH